MKKLIYIFCAVAIAGLVALRVSALGNEKHQYVFNATRNALDVGAPIETLVVKTTDGILREPIHISGNRGYVSGARVGKFAAGQKIGKGEIISVSKTIDLDTGMYIVRTKNVTNGLHHAESKVSGIFIPGNAIKNETVIIADGDVARAQKIKVESADAENALISGLNENDILILSHVNDGDKIVISNQ